jgi:hypothetical protein
MLHSQMPRYIVVDIAEAYNHLDEFKIAKPHLLIDLPMVLEVVVDYLNKPLTHNACFVHTAEHLVNDCVAYAYEFHRKSSDSLAAKQAFVKFICECSKIFDHHGLYVGQRLHYAYRPNKTPTKLLLEKRKVPIY